MPARPRDNRTPDGAKRRWTADDRARRSGAPGSRRGDAPQRDDRRPDWFPGGRTADEGASRGRGDRPVRGRTERPARDDRRPDRGFRDDRPARSDRGSRDERPRSFRDGDRPARGPREDRPARSFRDGDRPARGPREDRPARSFRDDERPARDDRGFHGDRSARADRPFRGDRDDRPRRDEDRPARGSREDRPARSFRDDDRPARDDRGFQGDRPARADRPFRGDRDDRPRRDERSYRPEGDRRGDRPARDDRPVHDRGSRPEQGRREDRPARDERPYRAERPRSDERGERPYRDPRASRFQRDDRRDAPASRGPRRDAADRRPAADRGRDERAPRWEQPEDVVLERLDAEVVTAEDVAGSSFASLGLGPRIAEALAELGATEPFPIQSATIPDALAGRDVLGRGRTGSGKTIAFGAALVERLMRNWAESGRSGTGRKPGRAPRALIMAPTRELALQIDRTVQPLARAVGLYTTQIVGGVPQARQVGALSKGVDIVIGTPGRIEDLLEQGRLDLSHIEIAVLDEADHMAELGFLEPMQRLLRRIPEGGQRMLFSATLDAAVGQLVDEFLTEPSVHEVADPEGAGTADHRVLVIEPGEKLPVLTALIDANDRTLVFARTRAFAEQLADDLEDAGVRAESLHGDLNQSRRTRALQRFSDGRVAALVATDVAARGIHVDAIDLVVHADAAEDYKTYLHRSGRTGRAGASGTVVTLINPRRRRRFTELLDRAEIEAAFSSLRPGDDPVAAIRA